MIEVRYKGRLGNNLFQYCLGRILAEKAGYRLDAPAIDGFPNTKKAISGKDLSDCPAVTLSGQTIDIEGIAERYPQKRIVLNGHFQRYDYYRAYKERIRDDWLLMETSKHHVTDQGDIVIHARVGDYRQLQSILPISYYEEAIERARPKKVFICTDNPFDPFVKNIKRRYRADIFHASPLEDFAFITRFKKIIMSQSSFSWWAAFLSKADEIYFPIVNKGLWSPSFKNRPHLSVDDERRYQYLKVTDEYIISGRERMFMLKNSLLEKIGFFRFSEKLKKRSKLYQSALCYLKNR